MERSDWLRGLDTPAWAILPKFDIDWEAWALPLSLAYRNPPIPEHPGWTVRLALELSQAPRSATTAVMS